MEEKSPELNPHLYGSMKQRQDYTMGKRHPLQSMVLGKQEGYMKNNQTRLFYYIT